MTHTLRIKSQKRKKKGLSEKEPKWEGIKRKGEEAVKKRGGRKG